MKKFIAIFDLIFSFLFLSSSVLMWLVCIDGFVSGSKLFGFGLGISVGAFLAFVFSFVHLVYDYIVLFKSISPAVDINNPI